MTEERERRRMLGRLRQYLARRRSPRSVLSAIMMLTAISGFLASMGMLKLGLGAMWLRYPLAVLVAWGVFLALVRAWAQREHEEVRVVIVFLVAAGFLMQWYAPEAPSIGMVWRHWRGPH